MNNPVSNHSLHSILEMCTAELVAVWHQTFNHPPPVKCGEALLRGALGWHAQAYMLGGLSHSAQKVLRQPSKVQPLTLTVGSRLVRVWQDQTHQVTILEDGFDYDGKRWTSLSAIAKTITGSPWSGPAFFGLKKLS